VELVTLALIIAGSLALFISRLVPYEITAILIVSALAISGILSPAEALLGFSSTATITIAAMFVIGAGLGRTGVVDAMATRLTRHAPTNLTTLLLVMAGVVGLTSAFVSNTPVVVILVPVVLSLCRKSNIPPSRLFLPLSYFAILGGTCTLIGTSTNILIDDLYRRAGGPGFHIFTFAPVGSVYLVVGVLAIVLLARHTLPERASLASLIPAERKARFVTEVVVTAGAPIAGHRVGEVFRPGSPVRLLELIRGEEIFLGARASEQHLEPDDALIVEGTPQEISAFLSRFAGVELASVVEDEQRVPMKTLQLRLVEAVVLPDAPFDGRYVRDLGLNRLYGVKVMAVQRHGRQHRYQIRAMRLHGGDVMLLQADDHGLAALREQGALMIVEGVEETVHLHRKLPIAVAIMVAFIIATGFFRVPLVVAALLGAALMVMTRCLRVDEAVRSLDFSTLLLLAGTIPLGVAMLKTGLAPVIVKAILVLVGNSPPWVLLSTLYIITAVMTSFLSNHAAAVLLTPIAIDMAANLGIDPRALLIAVAFGASACFSTPIGYQTNAIVMGPGGYTFGDYLRIGLPLTLIMWIAATVLIPMFWPLVAVTP